MASTAAPTSSSHSVSPQNQPNPHQQLIGMLAGFWSARTLQLPAALHLAHHIELERSRDVAEIAPATGTDRDALYRLMRGLASVGVFAEEGPRQFRHTPISRLIRWHEPGNMRAFCEAVLGGGHHV